jgi:small subunit ribosomal protein S17
MTEKMTKKEGVATKSKKTLNGVVVSDKMKDTIVVEVSSYEKHPKYGKYISKSKKFKAHDAGNTKKIGDKVSIEECAPISKDKHFKVVV